MSLSLRRSALLRRGLGVTLMCGAALLGSAVPAFAHAQLESSSPAGGSSVATAPSQVSVTFDEPPQAGFSTLTVIGPDGTAYQTGKPTLTGSTVSIGVSPLGPAGQYQIGYRVVSDDGHPVTGSLAFTLSTPGPAAAAPTAAPVSAPVGQPTAAPTAPAPATASATAVTPTSQDTGMPVWPWIVGGVLLVGAGAFAALRLGRRS